MLPVVERVKRVATDVSPVSHAWSFRRDIDPNAMAVWVTSIKPARMASRLAADERASRVGTDVSRHGLVQGATPHTMMIMFHVKLSVTTALGRLLSSA